MLFLNIMLYQPLERSHISSHKTCAYLFTPYRASRYTGSRYDGDSRRSRSRDRSPDRRSLYSDGGPRRSSAESRSNSSAFQTNRDSFRDALPRDPPRGPKALLDAPSGPRGGGYSGDFRGRGRGRGRGWRDDKSRASYSGAGRGLVRILASVSFNTEERVPSYHDEEGSVAIADGRATPNDLQLFKPRKVCI